MVYTIRRFALAVITLPIALVAYAVVYFGLALFADYASIGLFVNNLFAVGFGWIVSVTFLKQILDFIEKIGE
jgi:hypothetical protein